MLNRLKLFIPLFVFILLALVFWSFEQRIISGDHDPSALPSALVGKAVPTFNLPSLNDAEVQLTNADLNQLPALLNVWATWCISCRVEHAYLNALSTRGINVYGLNYKDDREDAKLWLSRLGNPYLLNLFDSEGKLGLNLGVYGAPETYVIDRKGIIRYRHVGVMDEKVWQSKIVPLGLDWQ